MNTYLSIVDTNNKHIFSVEEGNIIKWTDSRGKLHIVKSKKDLDTAMQVFIDWIRLFIISK